MKALVTGASSGIGKEMAYYLDKLGYDLILVARDKVKLEEVQNKLSKKSKIVIIDLANEKKIKDLYMLVKNENIDLLINNAGFGLFGDYEDVDLLKELEMIDVNVKAVHILTRMFLKDMDKRGSGRIINVASSAGLLKGGPLMSTYYATKSYVVSFSLAIYEELRRKNSNVKISVLCPGPVNTNFNNVAGVKFNIKSLTAEYVAKYAINQSLKNNKLIIIENDNYKRAIIRGAFLGAGSINNPSRTYHLEINLSTKSNMEFLDEILKQCNIRCKKLENNNSIYLKDGEEISAIIALFGASSSVLKFEDIRVQKEMNGKVNRIVNCQSANLNKTLNASVEQIDAIRRLQQSNKFNNLDDNLKEIAMLRLEYPDASLVELGQKVKVPLGKSGVNYRLKRIVKIAEDL